MIEQSRMPFEIEYKFESVKLSVKVYVAQGTGLCLHGRLDRDETGWTITHVSSGEAVCKADDADMAKVMVVELLKLTDWNQDHDTCYQNVINSLKIIGEHSLQTYLENKYNQLLGSWKVAV